MRISQQIAENILDGWEGIWFCCLTKLVTKYEMNQLDTHALYVCEFWRVICTICHSRNNTLINFIFARYHITIKIAEISFRIIVFSLIIGPHRDRQINMQQISTLVLSSKDWYIRMCVCVCVCVHVFACLYMCVRFCLCVCMCLLFVLEYWIDILIVITCT